MTEEKECNSSPQNRSPQNIRKDPPSLSQLREKISNLESNPRRREGLFERFGGPRSAIVKGLTDAVIRFVLSEWNQLNDELVLDYGCGVIPYKIIFELAGAKIKGADIGNNPNADFHILENAVLPILNNSYDYVISIQVLEHIPVPQEYLHEAIRILKPGGKLFLTTHGVWPYHPTPKDFHRWTISGLAAELEHAGFKVDSITPILNDYSALVQSIVMTAEYRGVWRFFRYPIHLFTRLVIIFLEKISRHPIESPAIVCITGKKQ